mgnify:CR=1 FL=1
MRSCLIAGCGDVGTRLGLRLAASGIEAEIVDLRSLRPLDDATILGSARRRRRVVIVDEDWRTGSLAAAVAMRKPLS